MTTVPGFEEEYSMKRLLLGLIPALFLVLAGSAVAAQSTPTAATPTVLVRQSSTLGPFLTDASGKTLYLFTKDTVKGESSCYNKCETNWPVFTATEPLTLPDGVAGELTTITRTDGTTQVAYNGIPLYYFAGDANTGDTNGQGVGDVWYVVTPGMEFGQPYASPVASPVASPAAAADGVVDVTLSEFIVSATANSFKVGQTYTFNITNQGGYTHEFIVEPVGAVDQPIEINGAAAEAEDIASGSTTSVEVTFSEPGVYQIACHLHGHYAQGMAMTIYVTK
jgi:predicted lipoprotein with Yx(FWY)xxD motif/uncharacterized cupredoxin-like copper-binding protein